ncbi:PQQ-dependent sugar dehydrogenase [bacterium]|nr:PQQ-dependent sugar dehydrogenase [bacterium]
MPRYINPFLVLLTFATTSASGDPLVDLQVRRVFSGLSFASPVYLTHAGDRSDRVFVVEKAGTIRVFPNRDDAALTKTFLDIRGRVNAAPNEAGLLGLAFHPGYGANGRFYVYYTTGALTSRFSEFRVSGDPDRADEASERVLFEVAQPASNHNGGQLAFGPDGRLYIGLGDGGGAGDTYGNSQNLRSLLAKILRIDVDGRSGSLGYGIPRDNPYVGNASGWREEVWAWGLRNPWRFSFDRFTGLLWAADVGQGQWEEVDLIEKGRNYGWNRMEGRHCYSPASGCDTTGLTMPVYEYSHAEGQSITGGYVYRGARLTRLTGVYFCGDYVSRRIWGLRHENGKLVESRQVGQCPSPISSFGEDEAGEVYLVGYDGRIYALDDPRGPVQPNPAADFDGNGTVDFDDFFAFAEAFGQRAEGARAKFDLDADGAIDFDDFFIFVASFGKRVASGVPPASDPPASLAVEEFVIPRSNAFPHDPAVGRDGVVWYTDQRNSTIGRLDPATGQIVDYPTPTPASGPHGIAVAPDGYVWYTAQSAGKLGRLDPQTGGIAEFPLPPAASRPHTPIVHGGRVWFTDADNDTYGVLDPATGASKVFSAPTRGSTPYGIVPAPDGSIWVALLGTNRLGQVDTTSGAMREHPLPNPSARPRRLQVDSSGVVWYTDYGRGYLGALDPRTGQVREWRCPSGDAGPYGIALGVDGRVWFNESQSNQMVAFDPRAERMETLPIPTSPAVVRHMVSDPARGVLYLALSGTGRIGRIRLK